MFKVSVRWVLRVHTPGLRRVYGKFKVGIGEPKSWVPIHMAFTRRRRGFPMFLLGGLYLAMVAVRVSSDRQQQLSTMRITPRGSNVVPFWVVYYNP